MSFQPVMSEIREQVMMKLRVDPDDAYLVDYWMQQAYLDVAQTTGFSWEDEILEVPLAQGDTTFSIPPEVGWIRVMQMRYISGQLSYPMQQRRVEEVVTKLKMQASTNPIAETLIYAVQGVFQVVFWPVANSGQVVLLKHTQVPSQLGDLESPLIPEPYGSKLVEYGALVEGAKFKKDPLLAQFFGDQQMWMQKFVGWLNRRKGESSTAFEVWTGSREIDRLERESEHYGTPAAR